MSDLARATGAPVAVKIDGKEYLLSRLSAEDWGAIDGRVAGMTAKYRAEAFDELTSRFDRLRQRVGEEFAREVLKSAGNTVVRFEQPTDVERGTWMMGQGLPFTLWLSLRHNHPEVTFEWCESQVKESSEDQRAALVEKIREALDATTEGNSTGATATRPAGRAKRSGRAKRKRKHRA